MPIIDLSHQLTTGMPVYPGDPEVTLREALSVTEDGVAVHELHLGSHSGTHLDAPSHSIVGGRTVNELPLDLLVGTALILQATPGAQQAVTLSDVIEQLPERVPTIVCVATGWDTHFTSARALAHPHLDLQLTTELWNRGARVLGVDTLSPDPTDPAAASMPVHEHWLGNDGVIVENLARLTQLPARVQLSLVPLRIHGADGSPIRAFASVTEHESL